MAVDGQIGICMECKSPQPDKYILKSSFGFDAPCKWCGGTIASVPEQFWDDIEHIKNRFDEQRGLDSEHHE